MPSSLSYLIFAPDGHGIFAAFSDGRIYAGDRGPDLPFRQFPGLDQEVESIGVSLDARMLIASGSAGRVVVWDVASGKVLANLPHQERVSHVVALAEDRFLTIEKQRTGRVWRFPSPPSVSESFSFQGLVQGCTVRPEQDEVAFVVGLDVEIRDLQTLAPKHRFTTLTPSAMEGIDGRVELSRGGRFLLIYWDAGAILETASARLVREFPFTVYATAAALSASANLYALGTDEGVLTVRDAEERTLVEEPVGQAPLLRLDFSPDEQAIAFVDEEGKGGIYDLAARKLAVSYEQIQRSIELAGV